ncbi:hypothetical protein FMUND_10440 [Fusarium mundagurra]|uniref:Uncharacterized protein n=1 Tax=Fusarium mundagurra TaxID=1567541 RepID=A0A8H6D9X5_9HYPO|nr:hypothetical protein FMUND_10440 [Fusarium mundagurra]
MPSSANSDPLLFVPGTHSKISHYAMTYARKHPGDFLSYLRRVWPENAERLAENPGCLRFLNNVKVLLENGERCLIYKTWVPLPELRRLRGRYLLPGEKASFPHLDPPLPEDGTLGEWDFLPQLGCQTTPNLYFWVSTLSDIKFNSKSKIISPQRVKDLYLLLYEIYLETKDGNEGEKKVANYIRGTFTRGSLLLQPQGWNNPDHSVRYGPEGMYSRKCSMPLPAEWNATPSESDLIARFYKEVLLLEDVARYTVILEELKLYRTKYRYTGNRFKDISNLYQGLEDLDEFKKHPYILCPPPEPEWGHDWDYHREFVWSHGVKLPDQTDLSRRYPHLRSFFVDRLEIPELTMNALQKQILEVADNAPAYETFALMSHLNTLVQNLDELMDPGEFISKSMFPILTPTGELKRACGDTAFFIVDDMRLFNLFRNRANMLAFTRSQVMRLEPMFKWLGMQKKIEWDVGQKAEALLRIAAYFRSSRTEGNSDREELLQALRQAVMMEVEDMFSETKLIGIDTRDNQNSLDDLGNMVEDTDPQLKLSTSTGWRRLVAHVPADKKQQQLAIAVALPRLLMEWLMVPPGYYHGGRGGRVDIPELGVSLVKSVLNAPPELANDILEAEGIETPLPVQQDRYAPDNEVCLDQMEAQKAKAPLQATRTSATASPGQTPPVEILSEQATVTQAPEADRNGLLYKLADKAPVTESASRRKILIPHTRKPRPTAGLMASSESPSFTVESTAREVH